MSFQYNFASISFLIFIYMHMYMPALSTTQIDARW
jgi:hypothetical protein